MGLSVKVDLEAYPKGTPLGIVGVGLVNNGESADITPEGEAEFYTVNGDTITNVLKDQEGMTVSGSPEFTPPEQTPAPTEATPIQPASGLPPGTGQESTPTEEGGS